MASEETVEGSEPHRALDALLPDLPEPAGDLTPQQDARGCKDAFRTAAAVRSGKLDRARSRLYRSQTLQINMRLKTLAEIYTMHSFAPSSWDPSG